MRAHLALLGLALTATLSGCAAATTTATPAASPKVSVSVSPSPARVITIAVPKARSAAPALSNTGTSWLPILQSLSGYGQWLLANPDPALVGNVATPGCAVANLLTEQINGLLGSSAYVKTSPAVITSVLGPSPATGSQVVLDVVGGRPAEPVLSRAKGTTISTFSAYPQSSLQVTLDLGADKRWRFCSVESSADAGATDDPSVPLI
jgi:hypothetical protein